MNKPRQKIHMLFRCLMLVSHGLQIMIFLLGHKLEKSISIEKLVHVHLLLVMYWILLILRLGLSYVQAGKYKVIYWSKLIRLKGH